MKVNYRGFEIEVTRAKASLYFSVFRISDGWSLIDRTEETLEPVRNIIKILKERIDYYYNHPEEYEEN